MMRGCRDSSLPHESVVLAIAGAWTPSLGHRSVATRGNGGPLPHHITNGRPRSHVPPAIPHRTTGSWKIRCSLVPLPLADRRPRKEGL